MLHQTYFLTFTETAITRRWLLNGEQWSETGGFKQPATTQGLGKVYIFTCAQTQWPIYVGKTVGSIGRRFGGAFKCTPDNRSNGFAGYRFKRERTAALLHVFMADQPSPWTSQDAECIEAEVVFRIRRDSCTWPEYQSEIHFAPAADWHHISADAIIASFHRLKDRPLTLPASVGALTASTYVSDPLRNGLENVETIGT